MSEIEMSQEIFLEPEISFVEEGINIEEII